MELERIYMVQMAADGLGLGALDMGWSFVVGSGVS
jgi:hypothetical protein